MRIPRWLLAVLGTLIGTTCVLSLAAWWAMSPERSANRFMQFICDGQFTPAQAMLQPPSKLEIIPGGANGPGTSSVVVLRDREETGIAAPPWLIQQYFQSGHLEPLPRSLSDFANARQQFRIEVVISTSHRKSDCIRRPEKFDSKWQQAISYRSGRSGLRQPAATWAKRAVVGSKTECTDLPDGAITYGALSITFSCDTTSEGVLLQVWMRSYRLPILLVLVTTMLATISLTAFRLWPSWQRHRVCSALVSAIRRNDAEAIQKCIRAVDSMDANEVAVTYIIPLLHDESGEVRRRAVGYIDWWTSDNPYAMSLIIDTLRGVDETLSERLLQNMNAVRAAVTSGAVPDWDGWIETRSVDSRLYGLRLIRRYCWLVNRECPMLLETLGNDERIGDQIAMYCSPHEREWDMNNVATLLRDAMRDPDPRVRKLASRTLEEIRVIPESTTSPSTP